MDKLYAQNATIKLKGLKQNKENLCLRKKVRKNVILKTK